MRVFNEEQKFKKLYLIPIALISLFGITIPIILKKDEVLHIGSESFMGIIISISLLLLIFILIFSIKLNTKIDDKGVYYQFFPINFKLKFISWDEINKCYIRKYNSMQEFGGYGYRYHFFGKNKGKAINIGGNYGVQLELKNGKNILIGTQNQIDAQRVLETYKEKI